MMLWESGGTRGNLQRRITGDKRMRGKRMEVVAKMELAHLNPSPDMSHDISNILSEDQSNT